MRKGFRPLNGVIILNRIHPSVWQGLKSVSVPLTGLSFLIAFFGNLYKLYIFHCFRPLNGVIILNQKAQEQRKLEQEFPSP